ncbi:MAG: chorismate-binding protein [Coriobacteriales bacterium]|nr:chorismate-binding protein [Coriobacteriales bacterium]
MSEAVPALAAARAAAKSGSGALVLAPGSSRGWFDGCALVAWDATCRTVGHDAGALAAAGDALDAAYAGRTGPCAVVLTYEGDAVIAEFAQVAPVGGAAVDRVLASEAASLDARTALIAGPRTDLGARAFRASVSEIRERVAAGDVYVLNLTRRITGPPTLEPFDAFALLQSRGASDMSAFFACEAATIASISPERFLSVSGPADDRIAAVSPIKGTRPRGSTPSADAELAAELAADSKELAEHLMVVDLERNDLGRVSVPGTVRVDPLYEVVTTPYCHQLVSTVKGRLLPGASFADLLEAAFPCGSVTGAPKLAAIRIAAELERTPRGAYCGALLVALPGRLDSSVLIRTLEYATGPSASWGTGCGITYESDPAAEWLESVLKASPLDADRTPAVALRETCRVAHGRVPLLDRHLARLAAGGCGPSTLARTSAAVSEALAESDREATRLSITVTPDGTVTVATSDAPSSLDVPGGVRTAFVEVAEAPALPPGAAKPADRGAWDAAQDIAHAEGADIALLVGPDGSVIDGATSSVWVRTGERLLTPPAPPALDGVARGVIFDVAPSLGYQAGEVRLTRSDIETADEVFLSNAYGGVAAVRGRGGASTDALAAAFERAIDDA